MRQRIIVILALSSVFSVFKVVSAEPNTQDSLKQWQNLVSYEKFDVIVEKALNDSLPSWPAVHSAVAKLTLSHLESSDQIAFRSLASKIARQLEFYQSSMHELRIIKLQESCRGLIVLRDHIMKEPSYVNMVLADGINRVVFVNLAERLFLEKDVSDAMDKNIQDLALYACSPEQIRAVMVKELGQTNMQENITAGDVDKFDALLKESCNDTSFENYVKQFSKAGVFQLLEERSVFLLLWRYAFTDTRIKMMLPLANASMKNLGESNRGNLSVLLRNTTSLNTSAYQSVGAKRLGLRSPEEALRELVQEYQTQRIRQFLQFDTSPSGLKQDFNNARDWAEKNKTPVEKCSRNRKMIHWAKEQAAVVLGKQKGQDIIVDELRLYLKDNLVPVCPEGGAYVIGGIGILPKCTKHGDSDDVGAKGAAGTD